MNIAIIGAGNVGATLGRKFAGIGHDVTFGVQEPSKYADAGLAGSVGTVAEAAAGSDIILLALPLAAAESALAECGNLTEKIVIDATNPVAMGEGGLHLTLGFDTSAAEQIAKFVGGGRLVKCFNTTGFGNMADPRGSIMFACGDDPDATETVRKLAEDIGFDAVSLKGLSKARLLEPLAMLWIDLAYTSDLGREFAFNISRH